MLVLDEDEDSFDPSVLDGSSDPSLDHSGSGLGLNHSSSGGLDHSGTGLEYETALNDAAPRRPALTLRGSSRRMVLGRRRSALCDVDEEGDDVRPPECGDGSIRSGSVHSGSANQVSVGSDPPPNGLPVRRPSRRMSANSLRGSATSLSSSGSIVARKRRFSTEAHSSLIMANLSASLMGSHLRDGPDLDSLFDGENVSDDDDDDMGLLNFLRQETE